ncbi:MAG: mechanosensitive ion channel [Proteobacteria bacterium]|nr:mechanosensitive ion channel [Pseudomonadota bacterium]
MQVPGAVSQASDSVAGRLEGFPLLLPGATVETQAKIVLSVLVIALLILARRLLLYILGRRVDDPVQRYRWAKASGYTATVVALLILAQVWFMAIRSVGVFLGLLSAGLAIALKDLVADLAGWFFILWRKPFDLGDRIQVGSHAGDVVDIRIFAFTIMEIGNWVAADQSTGRMIHVPNSRVFTDSLANYTADFPFLWNEIPVLVTFESDWRRAKEILERIVTEESVEVSREAEGTVTQTNRFFLVHHEGLLPAIFTSVEASGVLLTARYLTRPRERRAGSQALWERILDAFQDEPAIALAYPTQRIHRSLEEGNAVTPHRPAPVQRDERQTP